MLTESRVYVVDDEAGVRQSLALLIQSVGMQVETFASADEFLSRYDPTAPGCLILDVRLPGMSGLQLQEILKQRGHNLPIIVVTGHGTIPMAVAAVKSGAFDFLEKPFRDQDVLDRVQEAIRRDQAARSERSRKGQVAQLIANLTTREREVLELVLKGHSNKVIASHLGLSHKTIEYHRSNMMDKLGVQSIPELVQLAIMGRESQGPP